MREAQINKGCLNIETALGELLNELALRTMNCACGAIHWDQSQPRLSTRM